MIVYEENFDCPPALLLLIAPPPPPPPADRGGRAGRGRPLPGLREARGAAVPLRAAVRGRGVRRLRAGVRAVEALCAAGGRGGEALPGQFKMAPPRPWVASTMN